MLSWIPLRIGLVFPPNIRPGKRYCRGAPAVASVPSQFSGAPDAGPFGRSVVASRDGTAVRGFMENPEYRRRGIEIDRGRDSLFPCPKERSAGAVAGLFAGMPFCAPATTACRYALVSFRSVLRRWSVPDAAPEHRRECFPKVGRADGRRKDRRTGTCRNAAGSGIALWREDGTPAGGLSLRRIRLSCRRTVRPEYEKAGPVLRTGRMGPVIFDGRSGREPLRRTALPLFSSLRPGRGRSGRRPTGGGSAVSCRI